MTFNGFEQEQAAAAGRRREEEDLYRINDLIVVCFFWTPAPTNFPCLDEGLNLVGRSGVGIPEPGMGCSGSNACTYIIE